LRSTVWALDLIFSGRSFNSGAIGGVEYKFEQTAGPWRRSGIRKTRDIRTTVTVEGQFQTLSERFSIMRHLQAIVLGFWMLAPSKAPLLGQAFPPTEPLRGLTQALVENQALAQRFESPRITALQEDLSRGMPDALDSFWKEITAKGAPLVEKSGEDPLYDLVTFVWRGGPDTRAVSIRGQLTDIAANQIQIMMQLAGSDLWFRNIWMRRNTRTDYEFMVQPVPPTASLDPLNPRRFVSRREEFDPENVRSVVELPDAPAESWLKSQPGIP
jgi:hypothetical protein